MIESELLWLAALHLETKLVVQKPIKNRQGKWVSEVLAGENKNIFYCSVLHWIDGDVLKSERTPQQAYQLGLLMAQLHQHSQQWQPPQNFIRPAYDQNRLKISLSKLYPAVEQGLISSENYNSLEVAGCKIQNLMKTLSQTQEIWGLIHGDLHDGNYLLHHEEVCPIDFDRCGFGYYSYDVAASLPYLHPGVRLSFFEGYQTIQKLPDNYLDITEAFFIMALIEVLSFHINNPQEHKGIAETIQDVAKEHIPLYLRGESFLFDKY